jgi:hypothetical protein
MLGAHRLRSVANRSSRRRQSRMAFGWFAMRTRRRRPSASPVGGAPSGGGSARRSRWRPRRPGQTDSKQDESTVVRPRREITSITTSRWAHQFDVTHSAAGVFVSASQRGRRGAPTTRPSETILGDRNYPHPYPHGGGKRRYGTALNHYSRVAIRIQRGIQRHSATRQSALLKTARAAKPSGVQIPLPPPSSLLHPGVLDCPRPRPSEHSRTLDARSTVAHG